MDLLSNCADFIFGVDECLRDDWIEVLAGALPDDVHGFIKRHAGLVNTLCDQGVENIGDGHDPRRQRDLLALEAARIALAVPLFVMVMSHVLGFAQIVFLEGITLDGLLNGADDFRAFFSVGLHDLIFFIVEPAGLVEDSVGDLDLADVMHWRGSNNVVLVFFVDDLRIEAFLDYITLQKNVQDSLVARIKIMGEMDIAERRIPQDGHFRVRIQGQIVNVRVNVIPTVFGEKVVMRLIMSVVEIDHNETFGMAEDAFRKFSEMLKMPNGLIYITGPTGSGKSTTLYNALGSLSHRQINISTIEDPVEKNLPRLNQVQVHPQAGLTFEIGLRALMRQDPDVIMVGETRDAETATIAIRAAITGHLVLSTLHTNDAASTVVRLIDMGSEPYLLSSALAGVVAQRLVRKVCPHCSRIEPLTEAQKEFVGHDIPNARVAVGCAHCHGAGYLGRTAIHEVLVIDKDMRKMVAANATAEEMKKYAIENQGMVTLKQACIKLVEAGITTMEELERVAYYDD